MKVNKFCASLIITLFAFASLNAQDSDNVKVNKDSLLNKITDISGKLKKLSVKDTTIGFSAPLKIDTAFANRIQESHVQPIRDANGLLIVPSEWTPLPDYISFRDTVIYEPALLPVVFNGKILPPDLDFRSKGDSDDSIKPFHLISPDSTFAPKLKRVEDIENMRREYYMNNPQKIKLNALTFKGVPVIDERVVEPKNPFQELLSTDDAIGITTPEIEKIRIKPVYWLKNGEHRLQLTYNTYSKKWGSDNNFDLFSNQKFNFNYKKGKIEFNNLLEWRLQLKQITSLEDKDKDENKNKDKVNIIEDYIRTYSNFGIKAFDKWSYSTNMELKTPVFQKLTNDAVRVKQRSFLSPLEANIGVGMRYATENISKKNKYRKFNLSADLSVLSVNYKYVRDDSVSVTQFGIDEGKKSNTEFGSTFNVNLTYSHNRYTKFSSRAKYFTNYEKVYLEWESSLDFALNSYFSTTIYLYLKYDDGVPFANKNNDDTWGYFNYNQMIRFGLTYTW